MTLVAILNDVSVIEAIGGFIETQGSYGTRTPLTPAEIAAFMPTTKGPYTNPAPYNTRMARITDSTDRGGDNDVILKPGYSYWPIINYHSGQSVLKILVTILNSTKLTVFSYNKSTEVVTNEGKAIDAGRAYSEVEDEHIYWSQSQPNKFYLIYQGKLIRYDHVNDIEEVVIDLVGYTGNGDPAPAGADTMWQPNSSRDDTVHSFTIRDGAVALGAASYNETTDVLKYHVAVGTYDECQITRDGTHLIVKQDESASEKEDMRIHRLSDDATWLYDDAIDGTPGHSDNWDGFVIGADNNSVLAPTKDNVWMSWDLSDGAAITPVVQYYNDDATVEAPRHVSANAVLPGGWTDQIVGFSAANINNSPHANEIFFVRMDGSRRVLVGGPAMSTVDSGGDGYGDTTGANTYYRENKGSLDYSGDYFAFGANLHGSYMDIFLMKVPHALLMAAPASTYVESGYVAAGYVE